MAAPFGQARYVTLMHLAWAVVIFVGLVIALAIPYIEPLFVVVAIFGIVNVLLVLKYPFWGLLAYLIIFLYRPAEIYPALAAIRAELLLGVLVVITIVLHKIIKKGTMDLPADGVSLSLFAFLGVMAATTPGSYWPSQTIDACINFIKTIVFYYMIMAVIDNRKKFVAFVTVYCVMIGKVAFDSLRLYMRGSFIHTMDVDRLQGATSFGGDPNSLANTMAISIPLIVAAALYFRHFILRYGLFFLAAGTTYLITITGSRGGMLAFMGVLMGGFVFARRKALMLILAVVVVIGGWTVLPDQYRARYRTLTDTEDIDRTSSGRWEIWKSGLQMIASRPILGVGAGAFTSALGTGEYGRSRWMRSHNLYIQTMSTTGIIGFMVWFGFFIYNVLKRLRFLIKRSPGSKEHYWMTIFAKSFVISMIALFVSGMFGHNLFRYNWYMIAGLTIALYAMWHHRQTETTAEIEPTAESDKNEIQKQ